MARTYQISAGDTIFSIAEAMQVDSGRVCAALAAAGGIAAPGLTLNLDQEDPAAEPQAQPGEYVEIPAGGVHLMRGPGTFGLVLVNADAARAVRYAVISGRYEDEGQIAPESAEIIAPLTFEAPVYVANLNPPDSPAIIRASILTEEMHAALAGQL